MAHFPRDPAAIVTILRRVVETGLAYRAGKSSTHAKGRDWRLFFGILPRLASFLSHPRNLSSAADGVALPPLRSRAGPVTLLVASYVAIGLAVAVTTGLLVLHLRHYALKDAAREQARLSLTLADEAERAFEAVELVQTALLERLQQQGVQTPEAFRQRLSGIAVHDELRNFRRPIPQLDAITIIDAEGTLLNFSRYWPIPQINIADRDYYKVLKADTGATNFIGKPVRNRGDGTWNLYIARRVSGPGGEFLGLILGALRVTYFEDLYQAVAGGSDTSIRLYRQDGTLLLSYPEAGKRNSLPAKNPLGLESSHNDSIVVREPGASDGENRLMTQHSLRHYPVVVLVSNTMSSILAAWHRQAVSLIAAACSLELVMTGLGFMTLRRLRGQRMLHEARAARAEAEAALRAIEARLEVACERDQVNQEKQIHDLRFGAAVRNMSQALWMFDSDARLIATNDRAAEMAGMSAHVIKPGMTLETITRRTKDESNLQAADKDSMRENIERMRAAGTRASLIHELANGRILAVNFAPLESRGWLVTIEDITQRRQAEARIEHMARHDALTGLANRVLLYKQIHEAVARGRRGEACAVLYLDLDRFMAVNDTLGHPVGDAVLQAVSQRLLTLVRETDTVARLAADGFAILQVSGSQPTDATALAARCIETLAVPYEIAGQTVTIGTSIGIAIVPNDGEDPGELLNKAGLALYRAKVEGRGQYRFFDPKMDALMQARRMLETDLRKALLADQFELFYQPLMTLATGSISGFEALMRWFHPERGLVPPSDFIPLAEEIGLIVPLGEWALRRACLDAAGWPDGLKVAVNVSVIQFTSRTLVDDVAAALRESGLDPSRLELEITETVMLDDTDAILVILHQLRALGVGIAMDDFGTGYSSLNYLRRFPFSKVKIDKSFIDGVGRGADTDAIVSAVTELCETLGMTTLAEGVETEEQLQYLRAGKCGEAQGYLFSPPRPASEVAAMCRRLTRPVAVDAAF